MLFLTGENFISSDKKNTNYIFSFSNGYNEKVVNN